MHRAGLSRPTPQRETSDIEHDPFKFELAAGPKDRRPIRAASSKDPDDRMALIVASESANDAAAVQTVLIVLGEIPLNKLLEVFH
jgi:hypothetical protein